MQSRVVIGLLMGMLLGLTASCPLLADDKAGDKDVTITGEVVDTFCYSAMGAKGAGHRECGLKCAKAGIPMGLVDSKTDKLYVLLPSKDASPVPSTVMDKMGKTASITGHEYSKGGSQFLTVETVQ